MSIFDSPLGFGVTVNTSRFAPQGTAIIVNPADYSLMRQKLEALQHEIESALAPDPSIAELTTEEAILRAARMMLPSAYRE